jgi:hypothetical protein
METIVPRGRIILLCYANRTISKQEGLVIDSDPSAIRPESGYRTLAVMGQPIGAGGIREMFAPTGRHTPSLVKGTDDPAPASPTVPASRHERA